MTELIIRLFIKNSSDTTNPRVRGQYGKVAGIVGISTNLLLFLAKILVGFLFQSISVLGDAVNNLMDSASSIVTLVGFKLAGKPADEKHPFGHARMEYISALLVSFIIAVIGFELARISFDKIINPIEMKSGWETIIVLVAAIAIKFWQKSFYLKMGKTIDSPTLKAVATDSRCDIFATSAVLLGVILTRFTGFNLDGYLGLGVAVFLIISGVRLLISASNPLLGLAASKELCEKIQYKILSYKGILRLHDLMVHNYGAGYYFASVHCEVSAEEDIMASHDLIDCIERDVLKEMNIHLVIHLDPIKVDDPQTDALHKIACDAVAAVSKEIQVHDFRFVSSSAHTKLLFDIAVPYSFQMENEWLESEIEKRLQEKDPSFLAVITVDRVAG